MSRRDVLTYDVDVRRRQSIPWGSLALLVAVLTAAIALVAWTVSSRAPAAEQRAGQPPVPVASTAAGSASASATASPTPAGSDDGENAGTAPTGSVQAASAFVQAWLTRDPKVRKTGLTETAVPALADQLQLTAAVNIPEARASGVPSLEDASSYSVQFVQALTSGMKIRVYLVADPQARYGWSVTSVERV